MRVINADSAQEALLRGAELLLAEGVDRDSRDGRVRVLMEPVTTVHRMPWRRVVCLPQRNANPYFHLFEAMWMLAGRDDGPYLDWFVRDFSSRFAEEGGSIHGAYGRRWRVAFEVASGSPDAGPHGTDQLEAVVQLLRRDPNSRQAVIAMWSPEMDLGISVRDRPCNTHIYLRVRDGGERTLDMTVCCRSNDIVMGAYGANVVHMSVLHEYLAARLSMVTGRYYQISNDFHAYHRDIEKMRMSEWPSADDDTGDIYDTLPKLQGMFHPVDSETALSDIEQWLVDPTVLPARNPALFEGLLVPMRESWSAHKRGNAQRAVDVLADVWSEDWRVAAQQWMERRHGRGA